MKLCTFLKSNYAHIKISTNKFNLIKIIVKLVTIRIIKALFALFVFKFNILENIFYQNTEKCNLGGPAKNP